MEFVDVVDILKSLIASSPGQGVFIHELERDFEREIGNKIPYSDLGFASVYDILKNGMQDVFIVTGNSQNARVEIVNTEKVQHVIDNIAKAKKSKTNKNQWHQQQNFGNSAPQPSLLGIPSPSQSIRQKYRFKPEQEQWLASTIRSHDASSHSGSISSLFGSITPPAPLQPMFFKPVQQMQFMNKPRQESTFVPPQQYNFNPRQAFMPLTPAQTSNARSQPVVFRPPKNPLIPPQAESNSPQKSNSNSFSESSSASSKRSGYSEYQKLGPKRNYLNVQVLSEYFLGNQGVNIHVVYSPVEFYFYFKSTIFYLTPILIEMNTYYQQNSYKYQITSPNELILGNIYVVYHREKYHRAQFKQFLEKTIEFRLCDYAFDVELSLEEIFLIKYDFIKYPSIIFRGKLTDIEPVSGGEWSKKAQELFFDSVSDALVWAVLKKADLVENVFEMDVVLPDTHEKITDILVNAGLAKMVEKN